LIEIFRVFWDCSGEAMAKISALYHDVKGSYSPNKGQKYLLWGPKFLSPGWCYILNFFLFEKAYQHPEHDEALFF